MIHFCDELKKEDVDQKFVFVRVDFNVPLTKEGTVADPRRIKEALPTLQYLLGLGAKLVLCSHLGRPNGKYVKDFSMVPVAEALASFLGLEVLVPTEVGLKDCKKLFNIQKGNRVFLLENVRFDSGEEGNSAELAQTLSGLAEIYVNDAFGASHRSHASVVGIPKIIKKSYAGFLIKKEVEYLRKVLHPQKPFCLISGGAKISDKIKTFENILPKTDILLIGGAMAYTFLKAQEQEIGLSKVESEHIPTAKKLLKLARSLDVKVILPVDHVVADPKTFGNIQVADSIPQDKMALDIGPKTVELFAQQIKKSATIFWNGPLGFFEKEGFSHGSYQIAKELINSNATTIIGGGDTALAVQNSGCAEKMSHISTGGGASLEFIENNGKLPGLEALDR